MVLNYLWMFCVKMDDKFWINLKRETIYL